MSGILERIKWDEKGLVPVITQDAESGAVLMFAWMNLEALEKTIELKRAVYFSRSRNKLWFKGEESGHVQHVKALRMDCDQDVLLLLVEQVGGISCHTGRHNCFFEEYSWGNKDWRIIAPVIKNPEDIYNT